MNQPAEQPGTAALIEAATRGDLAAVSGLVSAGAAVCSLDRFGAPVLMRVIDELQFTPEVDRLAVVRTLLALGADPRQMDQDGGGPLTLAVLGMDTELIRLLVDAGARPNDERGFSAGETLYDWGVFDYTHDIWNVFEDMPEPATDADSCSPDAWLRYLDRLAVKYGKRRPDHLMLLRERGALTQRELAESGEDI
jgi:hypothetical protein